MANPGKPLHYLLRGTSGSDAFSRNTSSALRNCIGVTDDPFEKNLITSSSKTEMANEIIILKESNNKLLKALVQKERECREFQDHLIVSSKTNADLMDELSELTLENQRLKLKGIAFLEENRTLYNQICQLKKMYSKALNQPSQSSSTIKSSSKEALNFDQEEPSESWEEISQKLLNQMQEEMMELESINSKYFDSNKSASNDQFKQPLSTIVIAGDSCEHSTNLVPSSIAFSDECELLCAKSLIHHLKSQVEHLKNQTLNQRTVLKSALEQLQKYSKAFNMARGNSVSVCTKRLSQPSDELFRAYFTKQLHNGANPQAGGIATEVQVENDNQLYEPSPIKTLVKDAQKPSRVKEHLLDAAEIKDIACITLKASDDVEDDDDKICPICERKFAAHITQSEFEDHVFDHLDSKKALEH